MLKGQIIVVIDEEGSTTIEVKGVKGPSCLTITKALEDALGRTTSRTNTKEYRESDRTAVRQTHRA